MKINYFCSRISFIGRCILFSILLVHFFTTLSQNDVKNKKIYPPCPKKASNHYVGKDLIAWPNFKGGDLLKINSLTTLTYPTEVSTQKLYYQDKYIPKGFNQWWRVGTIESWWMEPDSDPWSDKPFWGKDYEQPTHNFKPFINDHLRWKCGYSFIVEIPKSYSKSKKYPLIIYLHGSVNIKPKHFISRDYTRKIFNESESDPYLFVAPIRLEIDWDAQKIFDVIENIKENLNVDETRIYLTGLSMGGRGTFIVAAQQPDTFDALMPLSPHHGPFSYLPLTEKIKDIPIWMSQGNIDKISSYGLAKKMADSLRTYGANI